MNYSKRIFLFIVFSFCGFALTSQAPVLANDFAKKIKAEIIWDPFSETLTFSKMNRTANCKVGRDSVILDYTNIEFASAPVKKDGLIFLSSAMTQIIENYLWIENPEPEFKIGAILIDPGHGGKDPGAIGSYTQDGKKITVYEKDIALQVGKELAKMLKEAYPDKKIIMTRTDDTYPTLGDRVDMANNIKLPENESVIFISIHANSSFNKKARGFEVWYLPQDYRRTLIEKGSVSKEIHPILNSMLEEEFSIESILIAKNILNGMDQQIGNLSHNRGLKENAWFVVRNAEMPSVLIELGFLSYEEEAKLLNSTNYLKKCSTGIYNGLVNFISQFEYYGF